MRRTIVNACFTLVMRARIQSVAMVQGVKPFCSRPVMAPENGRLVVYWFLQNSCRFYSTRANIPSELAEKLFSILRLINLLQQNNRLIFAVLTINPNLGMGKFSSDTNFEIKSIVISLIRYTNNIYYKELDPRVLRAYKLGEEPPSYAASDSLWPLPQSFENTITTLEDINVRMSSLGRQIHVPNNKWLSRFLLWQVTWAHVRVWTPICQSQLELPTPIVNSPKCLFYECSGRLSESYS